jgi:hypothetical protein
MTIHENQLNVWGTHSLVCQTDSLLNTTRFIPLSLYPFTPSQAGIAAVRDDTIGKCLQG